VLISKPPHPEVLASVLARVKQSRKRFTLCLLGAVGIELPPNATATPTLSAAAEDVLGAALAAVPATSPLPAARVGHILGLYAGGSLAAEAQLVLIAAGRAVASNAAVPGAAALAAAAPPGDRIIDLGADEFTRGRPHPMIDPAVRSDRLRRALTDQSLAVILLDVVLGLGAHPDPARAVAAVLAGAPADRPHLVASVTGTEADPQVRSRQIATLTGAGVRLAPSNAAAAALAIALASS
jgi:FdrA protein